MKNRKLGIPLTALLLTDCEVVNPAPTDGAQKRSLMLLLSQKDDFMTTLRDRARVAMTTEAKEVMETWIGKYGDKIEMVICQNDAMALGVIDALRYAGKDSSEVPVAGADCTDEGEWAFHTGNLYVTVKQDAVVQAETAVAAALNLSSGQPLTSG